MKEELVEKVCMTLLKRGFTVKVLPRKWFDIVARKGEGILIIKALQDANSISSELASEMARIGSFLSAAPVIIAEKAGELLRDGIVYSRFGIYTISPETFEDCLNDRLPLVIKRNSGLTVSISGDKLSRGMEEKGFSLSDLSRRVGVSKQMIMRYRDEKSEISIEKAELMRRIFGESIFEKVDVFSSRESSQNEHQSRMAKKYESLGFRALDTKKAPFDIIAKGERKIILTEVGDKRVKDLESITKLVDASSLVIFDRKKPKERIPFISRQQFLDIHTARELIKFLQEFE